MSYHDGYRDGLKDAGQDTGRNARLTNATLKFTIKEIPRNENSKGVSGSTCLRGDAMTTITFVDRDGVEWRVTSYGMTRRFAPHGRLWHLWQRIKWAWRDLFGPRLP